MDFRETEMGTRWTKRKPSKVNLFISPSPKTAAAMPVRPMKSPGESPKEFDFNFNATKLTSSSSMKKKNENGDVGGASSASKFRQPTGGGFARSPLKGINSISDLKDFASCRLDSIKRQLDRSQSEILKDIDASHSRLHKRFKIQTQACQQMMDEAERENKKMSDCITETREGMKASYTEFIMEAQSSASRLCKTSIPEILHSFEKSINSLRSRYGISSTSAC